MDEIKVIDIKDLLGDQSDEPVLKQMTVEDLINPDHTE